MPLNELLTNLKGAEQGAEIKLEQAAKGIESIAREIRESDVFSNLRIVTHNCGEIRFELLGLKCFLRRYHNFKDVFLQYGTWTEDDRAVIRFVPIQEWQIDRHGNMKTHKRNGIVIDASEYMGKYLYPLLKDAIDSLTGDARIYC